MHLYEDKIASRWSDVYQGDPLAIRTLTKPREIAEAYAAQHGYEFVIMDTSPSLGALNKVLISTTDGFLIPCMPDMFSLYGIRNIGNALSLWKKQFETIYQLLSVEKRKAFPNKFVRLLGFTIFNAKKYTNKPQPKLWNLAQAHFTYAKQLPVAIKDFIPLDIRNSISAKDLSDPIGGMAVMHSHNTMPSTSQRYHLPMWKVPSCGILEFEEESTIRGNRAMYENTQDSYKKFATSVLERLSALD